MPPLEIKKAYYRALRADTRPNLEAKLKIGESGIVLGGNEVVLNDNATFRNYAMWDTLAEFRALKLTKITVQADNGGANEGAAPNIALTDEAVLQVNPTTAAKKFYNLVVASAGRLVIIENKSSTIEAVFGKASDFLGPGAYTLGPLKSAWLYSDGIDWTVLSPERTNGAFTANITGYGSAKNIGVTWTKEGEHTFITFSSLSGISNATTMTVDNIPTELQTALTEHKIIAVKDNGSDVIGSLKVVPGAVWDFTVNLSTTGFTASGTKGFDNFSIML